MCMYDYCCGSTKFNQNPSVVDTTIEHYFMTSCINNYTGSYDGLASAISLMTGEDVNSFQLKQWLSKNDYKVQHINFKFT